MFCNQCEQTAKGTGCTVLGVCGKKPEAADLMDNLIYGLKGLSLYANLTREKGAIDNEINRFTIEALFSTITNVNFDPERLEKLVRRCYTLKEKAKTIYENACKSKGIAPQSPGGAVDWIPAEGLEALIAQGQEYGIKTWHSDPDILSAIEILTFGLKGVAAYADHAWILGKKDDAIFAFIHKAMAAITNPSLELDDFLALILECGHINLRTMEILNQGHAEHFGHPVPTKVNLGTKAGQAILISGHDMVDLEALLKQTDDKGIYVYTHGEMLPAHGYPGLKKYAHLAGHYGTAWQNQQKEFPAFPGAILMTTNCIQKPTQSYINNIFTTGLVAWPGVRHITRGDFSALINRTLELPGFPEQPSGEMTVGFGHNAVLGVANQVIDAVKKGAIKHFFLIAGCDGAKPGRNYYTEFAEKTPKDTVILTLACGKYRFNYLDLGAIGGIPRLLDVGQCNDTYSAVQIALALANAFNCGVNDLPLSLIISWYEQKAVAVLLTLLYLGIKNIRLGPSLPAFVSPNVLNLLMEKFNILPTKTPNEDLKAILG
jgi:hydroxylamine reductase